MKFSLFSVIALASAAMAAPAVQVQAKAAGAAADVHARQVPAVPAAVPAVPQVVSTTVSKTVIKKITSTKVTNTGGVVKVLTVAVDEVTVQVGTIKETITKVKSGALGKAAAITHIHQNVAIINQLLTVVVDQLKDVVKVDISLPDVKIIVGLVIKLVNELVAVAKDILSTLGLDNILGAVLNLVFRLLGTLINLVANLIGDIVPGVLDVLTAVLDTLSGTALGPVVQPVTVVVGGLSSYLTQGTQGTVGA
ncbi:hypothetical protein SNK03_006278 [Fusarium graminearum]|uniref:Chromosome 2, complete genome n=2 Tax=Gibberella zeae TaxID=5518 RepID=I1RIF3_GIBZE|nr:hypothetical protein FGSG_03585 [Fusarium graminearum PH-1]EYB21575.1 hypothetical protein FG05_03585 [Fusarium graminearum]ESU09621.1 hypothetical protein FGSG_03585 [Fusarium graminearum PH-1]KAI6774393.1 hypothetical protein HG531_001242 [Fusarium graminearum]PCD27465.1 hypothetical protein FGRA07_02604 [Fusarium graminearum]CAF3468591.1 unnamed protein product [Fusarium graminearum]|eukprot:XP_011322120.1 hypothetical protein FGSG_03585 [Fusarium graminearum PH-1]